MREKDRILLVLPSKKKKIILTFALFTLLVVKLESLGSLEC